MKAPARARLLKTLRAARRQIASDRRAILLGHTVGMTSRRADLDDIGRAAVKGVDRIIEQLDAAIVEVGGE